MITIPSFEDVRSWVSSREIKELPKCEWRLKARSYLQYSAGDLYVGIRLTPLSTWRDGSAEIHPIPFLSLRVEWEISRWIRET